MVINVKEEYINLLKSVNREGIDKLISNATNMPVFIAEDPLDCVVKGAGKCLEHSLTTYRPRLRRI